MILEMLLSDIWYCHQHDLLDHTLKAMEKCHL